MLNKLKKKVLCLFTLFLFMTCIVPVKSVQAAEVQQAKYVALGDSISYGMSADTNQGYTNQFYNYLKSTQKYKDLTFKNLSVPGATTTDLAATIAAKQADIQNANIITISIGGNNLLGPLIGAVSYPLGVNPASPTFLADLTAKIVTNPALATAILTQLQTPLDPTNPLDPANQLQAALVAGVSDFTSKWPNIIASVKALAPNAEIYVNTVYNPSQPADPLYAIFNPLLNAINATIKAGSPIVGYKVVDVYDIFSNYNEVIKPVNFSIATAIATSATLPPSQVASFVDPHPNTIGHNLIFNAHLTPVASVTLDKTTETLVLGNNLTLKATVAPVNATNSDVIWTSSNEAVATVDTNGVVTSKGVGNAVITAKTVDGAKVSTCSVTVVAPATTTEQNSSTNTTTTTTENNTLPKTGSFMDTNMLIAFGALVMFVGILVGRRKAIKNQ